MQYDELIIYGYQNSSNHYQITVSHDALVSEGGAVEAAPITPEIVAETRASYDRLIKRSREVIQQRQPDSTKRQQRLSQIVHELQVYPFTETERDLLEMRRLCQRFLEQSQSRAATLPAAVDYSKMLEIGRAMRGIFPGISLDLLRRALERARTATPRRGLRVIVDVEPNAQLLLDLPWETLIIEEDDATNSASFLCFEHDVVLMRQIRNIGVFRPIEIARPLSSQIFIAQPVQGAPIDARVFADELMPLHADQPLESWWSVEPDMLRAIRERLARHNPQIVQLICHGRRSPGLNAARSDMLLTYVENGQTYMHRVSPHDLLQALQGAPRLQIVLLTVCDSGRAEQSVQAIQPPAAGEQRRVSVSNIAYELVRGGIPLVIAMQEKITQTAAAHFSRVFYEQLQQGAPIERALTEARRSLQPSRWGMDWTMPVVYRGSARTDDRLWYIRWADQLEAAIMAPRQGRALRSIMLALCALLVAGSIMRLSRPSDPGFDIRPLQLASLIWGGIGLVTPLLVSALLWPERLRISNQRISDDMKQGQYSERTVVWWAHMAGSLLGYTICGSILALFTPLPYLIDEWIPAAGWQLMLISIIGISLLCGIVIARSQARGAQANFRLYSDLYGPKTWLIVAVGMIIVMLMIPFFILPMIVQPLEESVGPSGLAIGVAVLLAIGLRAISQSGGGRSA